MIRLTRSQNAHSKAARLIREALSSEAFRKKIIRSIGDLRLEHGIEIKAQSAWSHNPKTKTTVKGSQDEVIIRGHIIAQRLVAFFNSADRRQDVAAVPGRRASGL